MFHLLRFDCKYRKIIYGLTCCDIENLFRFIVPFCFSKKESASWRKPDKGLHPLCRMVPWFGFCTTVASALVILLSEKCRLVFLGRVFVLSLKDWYYLRLDKSSIKICSTRVVHFNSFTKRLKMNKQLLPMKPIKDKMPGSKSNWLK